MKKLPEDCEEERTLNSIENKLRAVFDLALMNGVSAVNWEYFANTTLREILFQDINFLRGNIFAKPSYKDKNETINP